MNIYEMIMKRRRLPKPDNGITVLSLFDGMSCGQIALNRAGIKVNKYYASEIDKPAIKVTMANYPDTIQLGDVTKWREWDIDWSSIDLLIGGSPCQGFSFAGAQLNFNDPRSKLFFEFADILKHIKEYNPDVKFLLENVRMKQEYENVITETLGVYPVLINSALVSAQQRQRLYWSNWSITAPEDTCKLVDDILQYDKPTERHYIGTYTKVKSTPALCHLVGMANDCSGYDINKRVYSKYGKMACLVCRGSGAVPKIAITDTCYRRLTTVECERLQTVPDGYTAAVTDNQRYVMLGNGWTVDVIVHIFSCLWNLDE